MYELNRSGVGALACRVSQIPRDYVTSDGLLAYGELLARPAACGRRERVPDGLIQERSL